MRRKNVMSLLLAMLMILSSFVQVTFAETTPSLENTGDWISFRGNPENMGITTAETPINTQDLQIKWTQAVRKEGMWPGFYDTSVPPVIVGDKLYTALDNKVVVLSRESGEILCESNELAGSVGYSYMPIGYGEDMIFVQIGNGRIQALSADTLESLWISEETSVGGQTLSPITYKDGKIYTGSWTSEVGDGEYFCISAADENTEATDEVKEREWSVLHTGGFYWSGAYVTDNYAVFGGDDGAGANAQSDSAILYSVNPETGVELDKIENLYGDIRSAIAYDTETDRIYFTTKGGMLYQVKINDDGTFDDTTLKSAELGGATTVTPIVCDGIVYTGIQTGGNLPEDIKIDGPCYVMVNAENMQAVAATSVPAYAQASGLLSTAYKEEGGKVYIYTTYNNVPGGIYVIEAEKNIDESGAVSVTATGNDLYIPSDEMQNYCLSSLICDDEGTIYYKIDSGYIVALRKEESGKAITEFKIGDTAATIDEVNKTISIVLPAGTNTSALVPEITISKNASISPASGTQIDLTSPFVYTVTAENGETKEYTVTATVREAGGGGASVVRPKNITVCITVEKSTLGGGFIVKPVLVDTTTQKTAADLLCQVLDEKGIDYNASNELGFYLSGIEDKNTEVNIPEYIKEYLGGINERKDSEMLSEFDYSDSSGWMYMVDGKIPSKSASSYKLKDGDVIRWQFSLCGMGKDLTGGAAGLFKTADKDELLFEIAELSSLSDFDDILEVGRNRAKYNNAIAVASKIDSTSEEVSEALYELKNLDDAEDEIEIEEDKEPVEEKPQEEIKTEEEIEFSDTKNHWAEEYIYSLANRGIISGKGNDNFAPDDSITRAEFLAIIYRMSEKEVAAEQIFEDVKETDWFASAVTWAVKNGITSGVGENSFAPNEKITREQIAVLINKYIEYAKLQIEEITDAEEFSDSDEVSEWAEEGVMAIKKFGIISGRGDNLFAPKDNATRAEAVRMLYVLLTLVER